MAAAPKLAPVAEADSPEPDWSKPVAMRWWKLPDGEFIGTRATALVSLGSQLEDGIGLPGTVESITCHPSGFIVVALRRGASHERRGTIERLVLRNGHGAPA